jgi:hypothetical protein
MYRHANRPEYLAFEVRDGTLTTILGGGGPLHPVDASTFRTPGGTEVRFAGTGTDATVTVEGGSYGRVEPGAGPDLAGVAGTYRSEELDASWTLDVDEEGIGVALPGGERVHLRAGAPGEFVGPVTVTVVRDGGRVRGLRVYAGRVTGIVFERAGP